ncbi:MAG: exodeoxyribonuclease VII large subunit [Lachnospiraceae bacterium]|nr:exodeoxyribonuclease VII large subunit [Lachnospiraceae bacterium]
MQNVYSVAQVNTYIKNMFSQDYMLRSIMVRGEVSNCKYHSFGHIYFTLKDKLGVISCVMFAGNRGGLSFPLKEGMQVVVSGNVDVYERDGKYQLYAKKITLDGVGQLYERFEALKRELEERGLFAPEYKQPIPSHIKTLGVVTAKTGAAVRDIINIARRRNPYVQIIVYPAIVQGEYAAQSIANGIRALESLGVDLMIVGRGGGSIEDLWAFNEEIVAQAVFDCSVPIISAVGHETDTTIIDYVADLRAPTPSAAAELAVADIALLEEQLVGMRERLCNAMMRILEYKRIQLSHEAMRLRALSPQSRIQSMRYASMRAQEQLQNAMEQILQNYRRKLAVYIERLKGVSPLDKLNQGFSYVANEQGKTVNDVNKVVKGDILTIHVKNGKVITKVEDIVKAEPAKGEQ